jgi:release factor glutamine methyltransferase
VRVAEALHKAVTVLEDSGVESAGVNAQWLMAHVLGCNRPELGLKQGFTLTFKQQSQWNQLVAQRAQRIPLQHLIGTVEFCGLELIVNKHVLVPRPETEILAEEACKFAKMRESSVILDIGTGSGCLAIAIAVQSPKGAVHALDISKEALKLAQVNANRNGLSERIIFYEADMREGCPIEEALDLIVSNPPYIPTADIDTLQEEVREHDPRLALDGGEDGLDYYHSLITNYLRHLKPQGRLMLEVGDGQAQKVSDLIIKYGGCVLDIVSDLNNVERIVVASPDNS